LSLIADAGGLPSDPATKPYHFAYCYGATTTLQCFSCKDRQHAGLTGRIHAYTQESSAL
jgi:hypothetical protein